MTSSTTPTPTAADQISELDAGSPRSPTSTWLRRLRPWWQIPLVLWAVITLSFVLVKLSPGDPFTNERAVSPAFREAMAQRYGLDRSSWEQYLHYLAGVLQGDLGPSTSYDGRSVNQIIADYLPVSIQLGALALLLA